MVARSEVEEEGTRKYPSRKYEILFGQGGDENILKINGGSGYATL